VKEVGLVNDRQRQRRGYLATVAGKLPAGKWENPGGSKEKAPPCQDTGPSLQFGGSDPKPEVSRPAAKVNIGSRPARCPHFEQSRPNKKPRLPREGRSQVGVTTNETMVGLCDQFWAGLLCDRVTFGVAVRASAVPAAVRMNGD
jgi:hypothetical protein